MKTLLCTKKYPMSVEKEGGTGVTVSIYAHALAELGHEVHILTQEKEKRTYALDTNIMMHTMPFDKHSIRGAWRINRFVPYAELAYAQKASQYISNIVEKHQINIVHTPEWSLEAFFYMRNRKKSVPVCVHLHGPEFMYARYKTRKESVRRKILRYFEKKYIRKADFCVANSQSLANLVAEHYKVTKKKISIIHNPIDAETFSSSRKKQSQGMNILFVGRLDAMKGINVIIETMPAILKKYPEAKFTFIGRDFGLIQQNKLYRDTIGEKTDHNKNIRFLGVIERQDLIQHYYEADIVIMPSIYEPMGNVALEAMACGKPVIATNSGGPAEFIRDRVDGLLIDPLDGEMLASAIKELLDDVSLRITLGENALKKIHAQFTPHHKAEELLRLYESKLGLSVKGKSIKNEYMLT